MIGDDVSARFRHDIVAMLGQVPNRPLALAVSGGPDSMAMLALAVAAFPDAVIAATVDHRLRDDSAAEAAMVAKWCAKACVEHRILTVSLPKQDAGNQHSWAREQRYRLLKRWAVERGVGALCTAHHADDQAETFLMRAARGSGVAGLAAIRSRRDEDVPKQATDRPADNDGHRLVRFGRLTLLRPLLTWRRAELRSIANDAGMPFVDDPSNRDARFDRSRFRHWLESAGWIDPIKIARSAAYAAEADADLTAVSHWLSIERALPAEPQQARFDVANLPRGVRRYLARGAIAFVCRAEGLATPSPDNIEALLDALDAGKSATHAGVLASATGDAWHFRTAPPRRAT